jgi:archaellum component FlaC
MKNEMGRVCGMYGGQEKRIQGFDGETSGKENTWKTLA